MDRIFQTWSLMGASWEVLKKDKEILVFPFLSVICSMAVVASFVIPSISSGFDWKPPGAGAPTEEHIEYYSTLFAFYFCNYFVTIFFNVAIVACASLRMKGGDPTVMYGIRFAASRIPTIFGWAMISSTVGMVLRMIQERSNMLGKLAAGLLGVAWSLASFLVVPILVNRNMGAMDALYESSALIKKTWGEQLVSNFSFGMISFLLSLPAIFVIFLAAQLKVSFLMIFIIIAAVEYLIILSFTQAALQSIFQAAIYRYVSDDEVPPGFTSHMFRNALRRKE